jgi:predicted nucleic acid-binding protein
VAYLVKNDRYHKWAAEQWANIEPPFLTCEPMLTEANYLLRSFPGGNDVLFDYLRRGGLKIAFHLEKHVEAVSLLLKKYSNVPMSLADACLVRMAETIPGGTIITLDGDFRIYRKSNRTVIPTIMPEE